MAEGPEISFSLNHCTQSDAQEAGGTDSVESFSEEETTKRLHCMEHWCSHRNRWTAVRFVPLARRLMEINTFAVPITVAVLSRLVVLEGSGKMSTDDFNRSLFCLGGRLLDLATTTRGGEEALRYEEYKQMLLKGEYLMDVMVAPDRWGVWRD